MFQNLLINLLTFSKKDLSWKVTDFDVSNENLFQGMKPTVRLFVIQVFALTQHHSQPTALSENVLMQVVIRNDSFAQQSNQV